jgi:integrase
MRWQDITWVNGRHGTIRIAFGKTRAARRTLPMTPRVRQLLDARWQLARRPEEGWIWPAPNSQRAYQSRQTKEAARQGPAPGWLRPFEVYSIRHTFLTRLGESGCDVWALAALPAIPTSPCQPATSIRVGMLSFVRCLTTLS